MAARSQDEKHVVFCVFLLMTSDRTDPIHQDVLI